LARPVSESVCARREVRSSERRFSVWSVPKLAEYCRQRRLLPPVTDEWVRRLLRREGLTAQRVRTWKTSADPAFDRKKNASDASTGSAHRARR